ncbi:hypothetical protein L227DRAFT_568596 [Lentinus tigrinus ALCF2SS1-6]|uniref:Uncharacterized protein n=1 Tax=Lentinus tigrinus ALCF2SS1-6 TaxID=1328759 RepID=A0A5C2RLI6_9APHY|nr:hypothetical protein L227DRAFT_568596 [Lentinus tigrinus ALCF2SS1-6]
MTTMWRERLYTFRTADDSIYTVVNLPDRIKLPIGVVPEMPYVLRVIPSNDPLLGRLCVEPELLKPVQYANGWALHDDIRLSWSCSHQRTYAYTGEFPARTSCPASSTLG